MKDLHTTYNVYNGQYPYQLMGEIVIHGSETVEDGIRKANQHYRIKGAMLESHTDLARESRDNLFGYSQGRPINYGRH